jgi:type VI secretion system secreted protein VgrG
MARPIATPLQHSAYRLVIRDDEALLLDVLCFQGEEHLSQPFKYSIEFTCTEQDLPIERLLNRDASFLIFPAPHTLPKANKWDLPPPEVMPLRTLYGVVTGLKRLSDSPDEARYELTLEPRLALAGRGQQYRIYQQKSVPEIIDGILRSRHGFRGQDFYFNLTREYPRRDQVMQYGESDLAFIERLLAEVGIWYRFTSDDRLFIEVVNFHDHQEFYQFGVELPHRSPAGLSADQDSVWNLQTRHQVVEQQIRIHTYNPLDIHARLNTEVNKAKKLTTTYGEAYHYAEPYTELGKPLDWDRQIPCESGEFFARIRHEHYLNGQTSLSGVTTSATLGPAQVLTIEGKVPQAFQPRCVITGVVLKAARDKSLIIDFEAIPYSESVCFRPPFLGKPQIAGTVPARVTSNKDDPVYSRLDDLGRYRVSFLFDRDSWEKGRESMWLRLARPYAGATHGLHLPLIAGTEVAIAFEQGDPDRPYIAHALHDNKHQDHVTVDNQQRNVLRTPANNKLRMDDTRGKEHVKLGTDYGGKSQLNLGYMTGVKKNGVYQKRGDGFELRSDSHGVIRGGSGIFITAEKQDGAKDQALEMNAAIDRLKQATEQAQWLSDNAKKSDVEPADVQAQIAMITGQLEQLKEAIALISAPQGIALASGKHLQLMAADNLMLNAGGRGDISIARRLFMGIGQGLSLFVNKLGIKLVANQGPVTVQAQNDKLEIFARHGLQITSSDDEIHITAKKKVVINGGGSYLTLDPNRVEVGTRGEVLVKAPTFDYRIASVKLDLAFMAIPPNTDHAPEASNRQSYSG